jgi:rhamnulose-1-phosphate aldolase/alcohol dehydrogenase
MELRYLQDLWNDAETEGMDEPELLRYRSNLLGRDLRLTNFGGGNTSAKLPGHDPVSGETVEVLWVKGSGGDLGTIKRDGFSTLYMDRLNALKKQYRGVEHEDEMVDRYPLCTFGNNPRATSIDTPLHAFVPFPHVDHLHPDWAIALAACANGPAQLERLEKETGLKLVWLPWKRPGFELGLWLEKAVRENPGIDGIILGSHGLFTWGNTGRESYLNTLRVIDGIGQYVVKRIEAQGDHLFGGTIVETRADAEAIAAGIMPVLRGLVGPAIGNFSDAPEVLRFINSADAKSLAFQGTSCPDHFVRTKVRPLFVAWDAKNGSLDDLIAAAKQGLETYRGEYAQYYEGNKNPTSPAMRATTPTVVLVPGVGMFSFGRSKPEARITGEFYTNAIHVMEGATSLNDDLPAQSGIPVDRVVNNYVALPPLEAFNIEYWLLEEAKLQRMPPEKELSRKVALVIGTSPGIGTQVAERLAKEGAHIVTADINPELAEQAAATVRKGYGKETAGAETINITDRESVRKALNGVALRYGGVDILVLVAAVFLAADTTGRNTDEQWRKTLDINIMGTVIPVDEVTQVIAAQGTSGSVVLISSANAVVAKKGSLAYDTSKAAVAHLIRELAVTYAPQVRVNGVAPASVVEGSLMFPRDRVVSSLAKYNLPYEEGETTEELRSRLAQFYASRTLLKKPVTPAAIAEAAYLMASPRTGLTTGQTLAVDAGLPEAFLR